MAKEVEYVATNLDRNPNDKTDPFGAPDGPFGVTLADDRHGYVGGKESVSSKGVTFYWK